MYLLKYTINGENKTRCSGYRRVTTLHGALVLGKSGRLELACKVIEFVGKNAK